MAPHAPFCVHMCTMCHVRSYYIPCEMKTPVFKDYGFSGSYGSLKSKPTEFGALTGNDYILGCRGWFSKTHCKTI